MNRLREEGAAEEEEKRPLRLQREGKVLVVSWADRVVRLLVARGRCEGM